MDFRISDEQRAFIDIATYVPESIRQKILPQVASGVAILAICMTEPDAGTDVPNYRTNGEIRGERVVLKGVKTLISRADIAEMFVVFTRVNGAPGARVGKAGIPQPWLDNLWEWRRTIAWMEALGARLAGRCVGTASASAMPLNPLKLLARNLVFMLIVLAHGFRRLLPPY